MSDFSHVYSKIANMFNLTQYSYGVGLPFGSITRDNDVGFVYKSKDGKLTITYDGDSVVFENQDKRLKIELKSSDPVIKNRLFYLEKPVDPDPDLNDETDAEELREMIESLPEERLFMKKFYFQAGEVTLDEKQYTLKLKNNIKIIIIRQTGELVVNGIKYKITKYIPLIEIHGKYTVITFCELEKILKMIK